MKQDRVSSAVELVNRLIRAMCICPEQLDVRTRDDGTAIYWMITANAADGKRLVGIGGAHLSALKTLAIQIIRSTGSRMIVEFDRIKQTPQPELGFLHLEAVALWDDTPVRELFEDIVEACFSEYSVKFMSEERDDRSWTIRAWVDAEPSQIGRVAEVSRAVHFLFIPIGMLSGRVVYANVTTAGSDGHATDHAERRTARSSHVPGAVQDQCGATVSREPRGELGTRDVRLSGLGRPAPTGSTKSGGEQ